ncbi:hypothetical protein ASPZODRAFT_136051 [Penicilliopsis zonata CBS 506.65]|uniref:Altered inheritance of mitochondria protein 9, mitochondrial n=1 Tax=Penicilliopsis zonata CBS 506.65 TaxID=1073090 RepID=A0A1L9S8Z7_9EURO|nr:hypothetical protein ASPZODRAFT_136051 [Penicilliopsis zonata CBS 506.65]OJJ43599.1 hypothetical protein ASPZODRAFT_136051 [Penicilliopsis zonata CBS 506.65]
MISIRHARLFHSIRSARTNNYFSYTSGRWLFNEQQQLDKRYIEFDIPALQRIAGQAVGSRCMKMDKLPEGLFNKVFSLHMENGKEVLARIPNPNAGHPRYVVASEVATLDFLRTVLDIPVPRVLSWSSSQPNPVGAEYILMERVQGKQLNEVWDGMAETQRFGLVKSLVDVERRLVKARFSLHGSLYYRSTLQDTSIGFQADPTVPSEFVFGPTTQRSFWEDGKQALDIDRGPCGWHSTLYRNLPSHLTVPIGRTAQEYLTAVANREIARVQRLQKSSNVAVPPERIPQSRETHVRLLEQFLAVLPHILPPEDTLSPVLLHHDLHPNNIFVDASDHTRISGIIDWQAVYTAPLFIQAKFPSVFDCDDPYPWGAVQPQLPKDFESLSPAAREHAESALSRLRLKKFYELASRKFNPPLIRAMDKMRNDEDPTTTFIFHILGQSSEDGPVPLRELLIQIYEKWDWIMQRRGSAIPCPIFFSKTEIDESRQQAEAWADVFADFETLRETLLGDDGWVSHEDYDEAMRRWEENKATLENLKKRLEMILYASILFAQSVQR